MAGHSHWANIAHKKGLIDAKRGKLWSKLARYIIVAAKEGGGDPATNLKLRYAISDAKAGNMPKDTIERSIKKGTGELEGGNLEQVLYEGYGPAGVAVLCEIYTDNRNRTAPEVRTAFTKHGGHLGESGSVGFMFERVGLIEYPAAQILEDAMLEAAIDAGAENCETADGLHTITTQVENFAAVRDALAAKFGDAKSAKLAFIAKTETAIGGEEAEKLFALVEALEDNDDVQEVYTNAEISDDVAKKLSA
jgi:YebC/PmpR family DNA-binding regulatory protein